MDSNLLKEAIADAKAVRQTALANAKAALEEAFGTRLEAMFAPKLDEETADAVPAPAPAAAPAAAPALEQEAAVNEADIEEIIRELESELPQNPAAAPAPAPMGDPAAAAVPPVPAPAPMAPAVPPMDPAAAVPPVPAPAPAPAPAPMGDPAAEEEMDEEININELLEALKKEEEDEDKKPWEKKELDESVPVKSSGIATSDNKEPSADASKSSGIESSGQSVDSATVGTPDYEKKSSKDATVGSKRPNQAKNATKTNLSTPGGALKENTGGSTPGYPEGAKKTSSGDDASEAKRPNQADHATKTDLSTPGGALKEENEQLKSQLSEAENAITYLRTQLNEINLLNAKLLYTNRLFKEYSMDNDKKMKIVEMFDLAKNVREVKMTYAVIAESLNFGAELKKKSSKVQNITEGMASKPVAGTAPDRQIIAESAKSEMVSKFQKLAGIKAPVQPQPKK